MPNAWLTPPKLTGCLGFKITNHIARSFVKWTYNILKGTMILFPKVHWQILFETP